jgi:anti-sigma regulatory factor (Ser/Thr protein kinase)
VPTWARLDLPDTVHAPGLARRFVELHIAAYGTDAVHDAVVLVSELVSNAVRHGAAPIALHVLAQAGVLRVEVHDAGVGVPAPTRPPALESDIGGRGLLLVAAMASRWGVKPITPPPGKATWFELLVDGGPR